MVPKKNRIPRHSFPLILKKGKKYSSLYMIMRVFWCCKDKTLCPTKVSFVVSQKVAKHAVARNVLRRVGYGVMEKEILSLKQGYCLVFFFTKDINTLSKREIKKEIQDILKKARLYAH